MIAGVIGATGYAGAEVVRLLAGHPQVTGLVLGSVSFEGDRMENQYLNFQTAVSASLESPAKVIEKSGVVFAALPHGAGESYAQAAVKAGVSFIDLSADYRFDDDEDTFTAWYGIPYRFPALRARSVYGLPEMNRAKIRARAKEGPVIIGNPGCYPTGASLGAIPALVKGIAGEGAIIIDAASGVTGGGRELSRSFHYAECADSVGPYKTGSHRHTPEIARNFQMAAGRPVPVIFTPHLAPMNRGILSTIYMPLADPWRVFSGTPGAVRPPNAAVEEQAAHIRDMYAAYYRDEPFIRILPPGAAAASGRVRQSNFCDISIHLDQAGSTLIVVTAIDNMMKGAAGQAVQNMNIILGYGEKEGLEHIPALF
ncbi:MAG: N-acetyl-gamma-glutamyl-phosphate reductase [Spirochaetaceae bacterium]|jgi:N-acetyl-gamma-glutamyl-phosphate reductase|nr:N-acetyl-gamma-glutamyl-phosphate reductase [Spirochaetaceae bacterium]